MNTQRWLVGGVLAWCVCCSVAAAVRADDVQFIPDPGVRMEQASNPAAKVNPDGSVSLLYLDRTDMRTKVSTAADGLLFAASAEANDRHFMALRLPDGTYRAYSWDLPTGTLVSESSQDGKRFRRDPGARYTLQPADRDEAGYYDLFVDSNDGVVLLYLGDLHGLNNVRRAYSSDGGWTFIFDRDDVLPEAPRNGPGPYTYVDQKSLVLPDGWVRLITMNRGKLYSFLSTDDGKTFVLEEGIRLAPSDFGVTYDLLADPMLVRLADGRYRIYAAAQRAMPGGGPPPAGIERFDIVSATTR